jgi:sugar phosphate isomerase/epimerase
MKARLPLGIQLALPEDFENDREFRGLLSLLPREGFSELELNISDFAQAAPERLVPFLDRFGLSFTRLATGQAARLQGLSLSAADPAVRRLSVQRLAEMIQYAARCRAEVIVGLMKGSSGTDTGPADERFRHSLSELEGLLGKSPVPVLLEVTNRGECAVITSPQEALDAIALHPGFGFRALLDTWHLHREGLDIVSTLANFPDLYGSIHLSDDNRRLPGLGGIDFSPIVAAVQSRGYAGSLVLEGVFGDDAGKDVTRSARYLRGILDAHAID